jgi:Pregnancy-associated plasma protein-A/PKD domain
MASLLLAGQSAAGQVPTPCGTDQAMRRALGADYVTWWQRYRTRLQARPTLTAAQRVARVVSPQLIIPVVVHVIHDGGTSDVSDEQIHDAIRILNEDYQKRNADTADVVPLFRARVADVNIGFRLARRDPNGNCTNGITHTYSSLTNSADDNVKDLIGWDGTRYLNIWVVKNISFGAAGYAYLPCWVGPDIDGIVILNGYIGSIGTSNPRNSRALTHEVGHYLGLPHTWGGTNDPAVAINCSDDDGVWDTPNTIGSSPGNCNLAMPSCAGDPDSLSNVQNYMDYSYCSTMFTLGQADLMYDGLDSSTFGQCHATLATAANLLFTGVADGLNLPPCAPVVAISSGSGSTDTDAARACVGDSVRLHGDAFNLPANPALSWQWSFPGGQPATSTRRDPAVFYPTPGQYDVTLTASVTGGSPGTLTRTGFVRIASTTTGLPIPAVTSFEQPQFPLDPAQPLNSWEIEASSTPVTWEYTAAAAQQGNGAVRLRLLAIPDDSRHALVSPSIIIGTPLSYPFLTFQQAYSGQGFGSQDRLEVAISFDCGRTWSTRLRRSGAGLARGNAATSTGLFVPTGANWHQERISLGQSLAMGSQVRVRFTVFRNFGNAIYLDNLRVEGQSVTGLPAAPEAEQPELHLVPNPSAADAPAVVRVVVPVGSTATLRLLDATGRCLGVPLALAAGARDISLSTPAGPLAAGVYLVELTTTDGTRLVQRALVL